MPGLMLRCSLVLNKLDLVLLILLLLDMSRIKSQEATKASLYIKVVTKEAKFFLKTMELEIPLNNTINQGNLQVYIKDMGLDKDKGKDRAFFLLNNIFSLEDTKAMLLNKMFDMQTKTIMRLTIMLHIHRDLKVKVKVIMDMILQAIIQTIEQTF